MRACVAASHAVLLDLEGHGREEDLAARKVWPRGGVAASRRSDADGGLVHQPLSGAARSGRRSIWRRRWRAGAALGRALKTIKEQLRAVPGKGLGYGLLRYLNGETAAALAGAAGAAAWLQLSGPVRGWRGGADWAPADWSPAGGRWPRLRRRRSGDAAGAC